MIATVSRSFSQLPQRFTQLTVFHSIRINCVLLNNSVPFFRLLDQQKSVHQIHSLESMWFTLNRIFPLNIPKEPRTAENSCTSFATLFACQRDKSSNVMPAALKFDAVYQMKRGTCARNHVCGSSHSIVHREPKQRAGITGSPNFSHSSPRRYAHSRVLTA